MKLSSNTRTDTPTYFDTILWDPTLHMPREWREQQLRDQRLWSRKYLLPTIQFLCWILIKITRIIKRIAPFKIYSWTALNYLSIRFVRNFMSDDTQRIIFRHFALEGSIINFIVKNSGANDVPEVDLFPTSATDLGDVGGLNATLLHDCNIMNLFIDLGKSAHADIKSQRDHKDLDFSALYIPEPIIEKSASQRIMSLDLESATYIMVLFLVFLFDEDVTLTAANSLSLDESVANVLANITGDEQFRNWSPSRFTNIVEFPGDPAMGLLKHIVIFEYMYTRLLMMRDGVQSPLALNK